MQKGPGQIGRWLLQSVLRLAAGLSAPAGRSSGALEPVPPHCPTQSLHEHSALRRRHIESLSVHLFQLPAGATDHHGAHRAVPLRCLVLCEGPVCPVQAADQEGASYGLRAG